MRRGLRSTAVRGFHCLGGFFICFGFCLIGRPIVGLILTAIVACGKQLANHLTYQREPDIMDALCIATGGLLAFMLIL